MITFSKVMNSASFSDDMAVNCEQGLIQYIKVMFKVQINSEYNLISVRYLITGTNKVTQEAEMLLEVVVRI